MGAWKLNRDESDDPKARSNQRKVNDPNQNRGGNSGPRVGFPGGGMGGPGMAAGNMGIMDRKRTLRKTGSGTWN